MRIAVYNHLPVLPRAGSTLDSQTNIDAAFAKACSLDKLDYSKGLDGFLVVADYDKWNAAYYPQMDMIEVQRKFLKHPFRDQVQMFVHEIGHRGEEVDPSTYKRYVKQKLNTPENFLAMANRVHKENYKSTGHDDIDAEVFAESYSRYCLGWPLPEGLRKFWEARAQQ